MEPREDKQDHYDSCFSWIVCLCSFAAQAVVSFNIVCFGVLLPDFTAYFEQTQSVMGLLGASRLGLVFFAGTFSGGLTQVFGCRAVVMVGFFMSAVGTLASAFVSDILTLAIMFGLVAGLGTGLCQIPLTVIVQRYFKKRRALAISIASAGMSFGSVTLGSISGVLLRWLSWRGFLVVLACCNIQILLPAAFFFPVQQKKNTGTHEKSSIKSNPEQENLEMKGHIESEIMHVKKTSRLKTLISLMFDISLFKIKPFLVFCLSFLVVNMGFTGSYMLGPNRAAVQGVEKIYIGFLLTCVGCMAFFGRILAGFIADLAIIDISLQFSVSVFCTACVMFLSMLAGSRLALHLLFSGLTGLFLGSYEGIFAMFIFRTVGAERFPRGMAWIMCMRGLSNIVALPLTGWLFDISQGYVLPYVVLASVQMLGAVAVFTTRFMKSSSSHDAIHQNKTKHDPLLRQ